MNVKRCSSLLLDLAWMVVGAALLELLVPALSGCSCYTPLPITPGTFEIVASEDPTLVGGLVTVTVEDEDATMTVTSDGLLGGSVVYAYEFP